MPYSTNRLKMALTPLSFHPKFHSILLLDKRIEHSRKVAYDINVMPPWFFVTGWFTSLGSDLNIPRPLMNKDYDHSIFHYKNEKTNIWTSMCRGSHIAKELGA